MCVPLDPSLVTARNRRNRIINFGEGKFRLCSGPLNTSQRGSSDHSTKMPLQATMVLDLILVVLTSSSTGGPSFDADILVADDPE
jgi:hypothetical protein